MNISYKRHVLYGLIILVVGGIVYSNSFSGSFHFDDYSYIVNKESIRDITDIKAIYKALGHPSRFIAFYSFALNYHFHKLDVFGYHCLNFVIHFFNALCVYWFILLLFRTPNIRQQYQEYAAGLIALFSGLMFMTHPIQTEAVTYIVQRFTSLATLFYLLSICFYLKGRLTGKAYYFVLFIVSALLGMFTKQICFTIPIIVGVLELSLFHNQLTEFIKKRWALLVILGLLLIVIPSFFGFNPERIIGREFPSRSHTGDVINAQTYFLTQMRVIPTYLRLLIAPYGQTLDYDFHASTSLFDPKTLAGFIFLAFLFILGAMNFKKKRFLSLGILWLFITISVTSSIIPIPQVIFEHRVYLPIIGFILIFNTAIYKLISNRAQYISFMCVVILLFGVQTYQRNAIWQSDLTLWEDIVLKAPKKVRVYNNLAMAYLANGEYEKSIVYLNQALSMNPTAARVYNNRGLAYVSLKEDQKALSDFNKAIYLYLTNKEQKADLSKKVWAEVFNNRGQLFEHQKQFDRALMDYLQAYEINPRNERVLYNIGYMYELKQQVDRAAVFYKKAIAVNPEFYRPYVGLGFCYHFNYKAQDAIPMFTKAIELDPTKGEPYFYRAISYYELKMIDQARADMQRSWELGYTAPSPQLKAARRKILDME